MSPPPGFTQREQSGDVVFAGVVLGVGLLNKLGVIFIGTGITAMLLAFRRDMFRSGGPWLAAGIALISIAPFLIWQMGHDLAEARTTRRWRAAQRL